MVFREPDPEMYVVSHMVPGDCQLVGTLLLLCPVSLSQPLNLSKILAYH